MPDRLPLHSALLADRDGTLRVVLSIPGDTTTRRRGLTPDGAVVHGAREDAMGESHVATYRFRRAR